MGMSWEMVLKSPTSREAIRLIQLKMRKIEQHEHLFTDDDLRLLAELTLEAISHPSRATWIYQQIDKIIEDANVTFPTNKPPVAERKKGSMTNWPRSKAYKEQQEKEFRPSKESDLYEGGKEEETGWERESSFKNVFGESEECNKALEDWDKKLRPIYTTGRNSALEHRNAKKAWIILGELQDEAYDKKERHSSPVFQEPIVSRYQTAHLMVDDIPKAIACLAVRKINNDVIRIKETLGPLDKDGRGIGEKEVEEPDPKDLPIESLKPSKEVGSKFEYALEEYVRWMLNRGMTEREARIRTSSMRRNNGEKYISGLVHFLEDREALGEGRYGKRFKEWDRKGEKRDWKTQAEKHKGLSDQWTITRYHGWRKGKSGTGEDILVNTLSISKSGKIFYKIGFVVHMMFKLDSKKGEIKRLLDWRKW